MEITPCAAPATFVPYHAVAYTGASKEARAVGRSDPLPTVATFATAASTPLSGSTTTNGSFGPFSPELGRTIWLTLSGTWAGTVTLKRSTDAGTTKRPLTLAGQPWAVFTGNACEPVAEESEAGATYYLDIVLASGTLAYEVAQ